MLAAIRCYNRLVPDGSDHHGWPGAERASDAGVARHVDELKSQFGCTPSLAAILVGDDPASRQYVKNKQRVAAELGCASSTVRMKSADATTDALLGVIG